MKKYKFKRRSFTTLTQQAVREFLSYNPLTGDFVWIKQPNSYHPLVGQIAGTISKRGCLVIGLKGSMVKAHRLVWLYMYGSWPKGLIDHINGDPLDNRLSNLRDVTNAVNSQNQKRHREGRPAIHFDLSRQLWMSYIDFNGIRTYLGRFVTKEKASKAYELAKFVLHSSQELFNA